MVFLTSCGQTQPSLNLVSHSLLQQKGSLTCVSLGWSISTMWSRLNQTGHMLQCRYPATFYDDPPRVQAGRSYKFPSCTFYCKTGKNFDKPTITNMNIQWNTCMPRCYVKSLTVHAGHTYTWYFCRQYTMPPDLPSLVSGTHAYIISCDLTLPIPQWKGSGLQEWFIYTTCSRLNRRGHTSRQTLQVTVKQALINQP